MPTYEPQFSIKIERLPRNMAIDAQSLTRGRIVVDLSSLPLQVLLHLNVWYVVVFWIAELLLYIYKGVILPYPNEGSTLALEIILVLLFALIEGVRLFFGYKGNLAERKLALVFSMILTIPVLLLILFLMLWQTYVLRLEFILCCIVLVFLGLEFFLSFATFFAFQRIMSVYAIRDFTQYCFQVCLFTLFAKTREQVVHNYYFDRDRRRAIMNIHRENVSGGQKRRKKSY